MEKLDYAYLETLVERTKNGSNDAFAELYAATYQKQYRFAFQYLKDEYLAQDALQEVYILVLRNIHTLKDGKLFISWLNQISFRVCFDMFQKTSRNSVELGVAEFEAEQVQLADGNPEKNVSADDERAYIMKKIMELPSFESQAIIMKYYNNMKLEDIAQAMSCNRSTVKRHLAKGREHLQGLLKEL